MSLGRGRKRGRGGGTDLSERHGKEPEVPLSHVQDAHLLGRGLSLHEGGGDRGARLGDVEAPGQGARRADQAFVLVPARRRGEGKGKGRKGWYRECLDQATLMMDSSLLRLCQVLPPSLAGLTPTPPSPSTPGSCFPARSSSARGPCLGSGAARTRRRSPAPPLFPEARAEGT